MFSFLSCSFPGTISFRCYFFFLLSSEIHATFLLRLAKTSKLLSNFSKLNFKLFNTTPWDLKSLTVNFRERLHCMVDM